MNTIAKLNVVQELIKNIEMAAASNGLHLYRYQTNGGNHATTITYALHSTAERPLRSDRCDNDRVSISQNEGSTTRCEAYRQLSKLFSAISK